MKAKQLAELLLKTPDAEVIIPYICFGDTQKWMGYDWVEVFGVKPTGSHRNAITLDVAMPGGGVIVVEDTILESKQ